MEQQQQPSRSELKPLINESAQRSQSDANLGETQNQQDLRRSINLDELRPNATLRVQSTVRKYSESYLDGLIEDMQQSMEHRYQKNRKLSHSRGIKLPTIKLDEVSRPKSIAIGELKQDYSPPIANSPVGYILRHDDLLARDLNRSTHSESFNVLPNDEDNAVDIRIFYSNGKAIQLSVENGLEAMASDLLQLMAEYLSVDEEVVNESLALWLISPLFELQLKPYHLAYELFNKWPLFLRRFTTAHEEEIESDEPLLVLKRNVNLTIPVEVMYQNHYERLTEILYYDAKDEFMTGRYFFVDTKKCVKLSALQLVIENGPLQKGEDAAETVHDKLPEVVPAYLLNRIKSFHLFGLIECKPGLEKDIIRAYKAVSQEYTNNYERRKAYLNVLRELPFYGASFFTATTDKKQSGSLVDMSKRLFAGSQQQIELLIGINCDYITLVDKQKNELLLTRCIPDCSWFRSSQTPQDEDEDIPSFFIHFPDDTALGDSPTTDEQVPNGQNHLVSRLLQIFSKQVSLIENLMNLFYEQHEYELGSTEELSPSISNNIQITPQSEINSPLSVNNVMSTNSAKSTTSKSSNKSSDVPSPASSLQCASKLSKLCTATLDEHGKCIEAYGNLRRILLECN